MRHSSQLIKLAGSTAAFCIGGAIAITTLPNSDPVTLDSTLPKRVNTAPPDNTDVQNLGTLTRSTAKISKTLPTSITTDVSCFGSCLEATKLLALNTPIDDETYEKLSSIAEGLAAYLETNPNARKEMLNLALSTEDGNKRALLMDAFSLLPTEQRAELGQALTTSSNWQIRTNGITLLSAPEILTPDRAKVLMTTYANETNKYVKGVLLKALKNSNTLRGDQATLGYLSGVMLSETDSEIRAEAMLTRLTLQDDPLNSMPDVFIAMTSDDPLFQGSAFIALEQIYAAGRLSDGGMERIDHEAVKSAIEDFMEVEITPENASEMDRLLKEADRFYERHFEEN